MRFLIAKDISLSLELLLLLILLNIEKNLYSFLINSKTKLDFSNSCLMFEIDINKKIHS